MQPAPLETSHAGQGIAGILEEGSDGLILGLMYLRCGRTLAVPIIAHGVCDTIDILLFPLAAIPECNSLVAPGSTAVF